MQDPQSISLTGTSPSLPGELPADYYLSNFEYLLGFVTDTYPHLLSPAETDFINTVLGIEENSRRLFVRLSNRKGPYFRVDRLGYTEIDIASAITSLVGAGLLQYAQPDLNKAAGLCTRGELLAACRDAPRVARKEALVQHCLETGTNPLEMLDIAVIEPLHQASLDIIKLLFFGNFRQGMTEFVMHELVAPFEQYSLSGDACPFADRSVVDQLVLLQQLSDLSHQMIEIDESGDLLLALSACLGDRPGHNISARRFDRTVNRIARQLERLDRCSEALALYQRSHACPSRERQVRLLDKTGRPERALALCDDIAGDPLDDDERFFALKFGQRLARKHALDWRHASCPPASVIAQRTIVTDRGGDGAEMDAAAYFAGQGQDAWYVENTLFRSLFGLAFWDVIFAPVSGAFFNPFQRAPLDIHTSDFYANRKPLIEARLKEIAAGGLPAIVSRHFNSKQGIANQFINWRYLDGNLLSRAMDKIPAQHHVAVFRRIARDVRNNSSGLPDLVLFDDSGYRLVEVKGPGDRLQKNQVRWFHYFLEHDIAAEVVNVAYSA